jgi:hypothetical protein
MNCGSSVNNDKSHNNGNKNVLLLYCFTVKEVCLVTLRDKFSLLVNKQFLMRCPLPGGETVIPILTIKEKLLYIPPDLNMKGLATKAEGKPGDPGDEGIYWRVNFDRFHQDFR